MSDSGAEAASSQVAVQANMDSNSWYMGALKELESLNRQLAEMKAKANELSVGGHLLNIDLATMLDPHICEALDKAKQDCERCARKMKEQMSTVKE